MRVGIIGLVHESNTFLAAPTTFDMFARTLLLRGEAVRRHWVGQQNEMSGFFASLETSGIEAVPIFYAWTPPSGTITSETCDQLLDAMFAAVAEAGPVDGYLVAPHGANTGAGDDNRDLDGRWVAQLRRHAGPAKPIILVMDPHGNLSPRMIASTNAAIAYRTNPHLDQKARGLEAAALMTRVLRGEVRPTQAAAYPPVIINIERQNTSEPQLRRLFNVADQMRTIPGVLSNSIVLGFPYADVEDVGAATIVVTDNDPALAQKLADELAADIIAHRRDFVGQYLAVSDAVDQALRLPGPIGLLDMGDNVGGGAPADGTWIAHELHRRAAAPAFVCIYDPDSAARALQAGIGATLRLRIGGKIDPRHGPPLDTDVTVRRISNARFHEPGIVHGGHSNYDYGTIVTVETPTKLTINLSSQRVIPVSIGHITCCGLDPKVFQVIVGKGVHAPVPALQPCCKKLLRVNTPGSTCADLSQFTYTHRRRPLFPLEELAASV